MCNLSPNAFLRVHPFNCDDEAVEHHAHLELRLGLSRLIYACEVSTNRQFKADVRIPSNGRRHRPVSPKSWQHVLALLHPNRGLHEGIIYLICTRYVSPARGIQPVFNSLWHLFAVRVQFQ